MERLPLLLGLALRARGLRFEVQLYGDDESPPQVRLERFEGAWPDSLVAGRRRAAGPPPRAAEDDLEAAAQPGAARADQEPVAQPGPPMDELRRVPGPRVINPIPLVARPGAPGDELPRDPGIHATCHIMRLRLADLAGERSASWYRSLSGQGLFPVPPMVPHPVGDGGVPLELAWWAVAVGRGRKPSYTVCRNWAGEGGAAEMVEADQGEAAWRGFATQMEAVHYLRAFCRALDLLDTMEESAALLTLELDKGQRKRTMELERLMARLAAGVTTDEMDAMDAAQNAAVSP